jgi:hypothetical protein
MYGCRPITARHALSRPAQRLWQGRARPWAASSGAKWHASPLPTRPDTDADPDPSVPQEVTAADGSEPSAIGLRELVRAGGQHPRPWTDLRANGPGRRIHVGTCILTEVFSDPAMTSTDMRAAPALRRARTADCAWPPPVHMPSISSTREPSRSRASVLKCSGLMSRGC